MLPRFPLGGVECLCFSAAGFKPRHPLGVPACRLLHPSTWHWSSTVILRGLWCFAPKWMLVFQLILVFGKSPRAKNCTPLLQTRKTQALGDLVTVQGHSANQLWDLDWWPQVQCPFDCPTFAITATLSSSCHLKPNENNNANMIWTSIWILLGHFSSCLSLLHLRHTSHLTEEVKPKQVDSLRLDFYLVVQLGL